MREVQPPRNGCSQKERQRWEAEVSKRLDTLFGTTDLVGLIAQAESANKPQITKLIEELRVIIPNDPSERIRDLANRIENLERIAFIQTPDREIKNLVKRINDLEHMINVCPCERLTILEQKIEHLEKGVL